VTGFEKAQLVIGVFQGLATILIAAVLYRQAQSLKRVEVHSHAIEAYNLLNSVAVSSPENLLAFDSFGRAGILEDDASRRRRWCAFIWLVALQITFASLKGKLIDEEYAHQALRQQLELILKDDLVYWLVVNRGFDPDFVAYCTKIRNRILPDKPLVYSEEAAIRGISDLDIYEAGIEVKSF
jgi:hypothetical protein